MEYIAIIIEKERIVFSYKSKYLHNENILKVLLYEESYIKNNVAITAITINKFIEQKELDIKESMINNFELLALSLGIIDNIKSIEKIIVKENKILNFDICNQILKMENIKALECYDLAENMLDRLEEKGIETHLRTELLNISNFVFDNKLNLYDDIYYREKVFFDKDITNKDITGFAKFCEINEYLKQIDIYANFTLEDLKKIIDILIENNLTNVDINIYPEIIGIEKINNIITELKKINKVTKRKKGIKISSKYTDFYKEKNYLKQVNFYNFKIAIGMIVIIVLAELSYMGYYIFKADKINDEIKNLKPDNKVVITEENKVIESIQEDLPNEIITEPLEKPEENTNNSEPLVKDFTKLQEINSDTVGWLTVNNTVIDYPVVKAKNNDYYLNKDFYKNTSTAGWIFMDYRNDIDVLDRNTIIYGHSGLKKTIMFAGLNEVLKESWYTNKDNQIITLDTPNASTKWQIFSIYVTEPTFNYISTYFVNDDEYSNFIYKIKELSVYDFGVDMNLEDKILTLTTCYEQGTKRLVVHAKLLK